jgi:hypothetical protein
VSVSRYRFYLPVKPERAAEFATGLDGRGPDGEER